MSVARRPTAQSPALATPGYELDPTRLVREVMAWEPFGELTPMRAYDPNAQDFRPAVDVTETARQYVLSASLPGFKSGDVDVALHGNRLTLRGKRDEERREDGGACFAWERGVGCFTRTFILPSGMDAAHVRANLKDGVLTVVVPKKTDQDEPHRIAVGLSIDDDEPLG